VSKSLDARLAAVAKRIFCTTHADIGSDHASLLVSLLRTGRIGYAIAVENKQLPFENSVRALKGLAAEVRFGDGLDVINTQEADSLSICGMGAESIRGILLAYPKRVPERVVIEVSEKAEVIRRWGYEHGFHLASEEKTFGRRSFTILCFQRPVDSQQRDPAYENVDLDSALAFGPFVLCRKDRQFDLQLQHEEAWWRKFDRLSPEASHRLGLVRKVMDARRVRSLL